METTNMEPEMKNYTSYGWSHWNCNEMFNLLTPEFGV
jgi:hypothetical protein